MLPSELTDEARNDDSLYVGALDIKRVQLGSLPKNKDIVVPGDDTIFQ